MTRPWTPAEIAGAKALSAGGYIKGPGGSDGIDSVKIRLAPDEKIISATGVVYEQCRCQCGDWTHWRVIRAEDKA